MLRPTDEGLFHFVMIKPSRYDDDGYPIQWIRSSIPSNTLACVNALPKMRVGAKCWGQKLKFAYTSTTRPTAACGLTRSSG